MGIGMAEGLGSVIYSLVKISEFINEMRCCRMLTGQRL
jgi:lantibiotic modifying enzyme